MPLAAILLMLASCAEEAITPNNSNSNEQEPDTKGLTEFVVADNATRTTAEYFDKGGTNRGLHFYWTTYDQLFVNNGGTLIQNASNTIDDVLTENTTTPGGVKRATKASFVFAGTFTAPSYPVRYTGQEWWKTQGKKVIIKASQRQTIPNDASHIGLDGDCGTATATKVGNRYHFTLDHKAAYITFLPFSTQAIVRTSEIEKIRVTADQAVCGEFNFNDAGIDLSSRPAPSAANQSIELHLYPSWPASFPIPNTPTISANAATMVIAPGSYTNFTVDYIFRNNGTISKRYPGTVTFTAGMNKRISQDLQVNVYPLSYVKWSEFSAKDCPNVNELCWYVGEGNPLWDNRLWANAPSPSQTAVRLYKGGIWVKKLSRIAADHGKNVSDLKLAAPNGVNYLTTGNAAPVYKSNPSYGKPADSERNDYFFLPVLGYRDGGNAYGVGGDSYFWSSTPFLLDPIYAYCLFLKPVRFEINVMRSTPSGSSWYHLWTADTNIYQPIGY